MDLCGLCVWTRGSPFPFCRLCPWTCVHGPRGSSCPSCRLCPWACVHGPRGSPWLDSLLQAVSLGLCAWSKRVALSLLQAVSLGLCAWTKRVALSGQSPHWEAQLVALLVACLMSQQQATVCQGRICSDKYKCCHTEIEVSDQCVPPSHSTLTPDQPDSAQPSVILNCLLVAVCVD